jgi:hypothetical protein
MVQYPDLPEQIKSILHNENLPVPRPQETWCAHDENESDVTCNDKTQHGLLVEISMMLIHCLDHIVHRHSLI